jgi:hypothetical protein
VLRAGDRAQEISGLQQKMSVDAAMRARLALMRFQMPSFKQRQVIRDMRVLW